MNGRTIGRFAVLLLVAGFALVTVWSVVKPHLFDAPPGDYEVRQGDILLTDGTYDAAIERFDAALAVSPEHRGALMGKAIAYLQSDRPAEAEATFTHLIEVLGRTLAPDDPTGRGVLSGAYANRGILHDRLGRYEAALADYQQALAIDPEAPSRDQGCSTASSTATRTQRPCGIAPNTCGASLRSPRASA